MPRRTVLRGLGATLALPLLDGMVPALTRAGQDRGDAGSSRLGRRLRAERRAAMAHTGRRPPRAPAFELTPILAAARAAIAIGCWC